MNRREFIGALLGTAAAVAMLPLDAVVSADPPWLSEAAALRIGDVFTIDGVYSLNPLTYANTGMLQLFVLRTESPVEVFPRIMTDGPYANCSNLPGQSSHLNTRFCGEMIPCEVEWSEMMA